VSERNEQTSRAFGALIGGIAAVPGDSDHPGYEALEALVDGRLDAVDREVVETHVALCGQCAEDVADLRSTRDAMTPAIPARPSRWRVPAVAAAAAAVVFAVWTMRQTAAPVEPVPVAVTSPAPSATPVATSTPIPLSPDEAALIDRVKAAGRLEIPASIAGLKGAPGTLLGDATATTVVPLVPIGTAVAALRPSFSWNVVPGAQAYSVAIFDDQFRPVARSSRIGDVTWTPTDNLPRERTLIWQVTAHLSGSDVTGPAPPQPEARFRIVDEPTAASIADLRERLASRPLDLAILLARAGLVADAAIELRRAESDPATAAAAKALRSTFP